MSLFSCVTKLLVPVFALGCLSAFAGQCPYKKKSPQVNHNAQVLPPINAKGAALFTYGNKSGVSDTLVFLQVVGVNPTTGNQCFIQYDNQGNPTYIDVLKEISSLDYAYPLSIFPNAAQGNGKTLYLPQLDGARIYTSINHKMVFLVNQNEKGQWTISAPNPLNPTDPNRDILWDKTEFAVNPNAIFINPTAVDDFSLPLYCEETGLDGTKQSGGLTVSRELIFDRIQNAFSTAGAPWPSLISTEPSLVYSVIFGAATGVFPNDLFVTSGWINAFKTLFSKTPVMIDAGESLPISQGGGIWKGLVNTRTNVITFNRVVDAAHPAIPAVNLTLPMVTNDLIAGNGPSWKIQPGNVLQEVFARNLSCAIDTNTLSTTEALNQQYFIKSANQFYKQNGALPTELQFIDYYSKVLHGFGDHHIYTIPYDDELAQSGAASYVPSNYASGTIILGPLK